MPRGFAMEKLAILALLLGSIAFTDPGNTQPAGGDVTGPATGGTSTGGNTTGGPTTGGPTTGGATTGNNPSGGNTTGGGPGGNVNPGGNVGVNLGEERRFQVQLLQFKVIDETGVDWMGSDEVSFVIKTPNYALFSSEYSVDSRYDPYRLERCVFPAVDGDNARDREWECEPRGMAPPFSFTVAAYEDDLLLQGDYRFCVPTTTVLPDGRLTDIHPSGAADIDCVTDGVLIGKDKVELTLEDLGQLQAPGQTYERSVNLKAGCDFTTNENCDTSGGPHYRLLYQVKRVANDTGSPVDPNP